MLVAAIILFTEFLCPAGGTRYARKLSDAHPPWRMTSRGVAPPYSAYDAPDSLSLCSVISLGTCPARVVASAHRFAITVVGIASPVLNRMSGADEPRVSESAIWATWWRRRGQRIDPGISARVIFVDSPYVCAVLVHLIFTVSESVVTVTS